MAFKLGDDLDGGKLSHLLNMLLQTGNTAAIDAALTALGQIGYDTTMNRIKTTDGTTIQIYLSRADVLNDTSMGGGSPSATYPTSQAAVKSYIDTLFSTGALPFTDFDATSTNFPSGATLLHRYRVSVAGTVHGIVLAVGDVFYPRVSTPVTTTSTDWTFIQGNVDAASNTVLGLVKVVADLAALEAETVPTAAVTVGVFMDYEAAHPRLLHYSGTANIAIGSNGIAHSLDTSNILSVQFRDASGPILFGWAITDNDNINVTATKAYTSVTTTIIAAP